MAAGAGSHPVGMLREGVHQHLAPVVPEVVVARGRVGDVHDGQEVEPVVAVRAGPHVLPLAVWRRRVSAPARAVRALAPRVLRPAALGVVAVDAALVLERAVAPAAEIEGRQLVLDPVAGRQRLRRPEDRAAGVVGQVRHRHVPVSLQLGTDGGRGLDHPVLVPVPRRQRGGQPAVLSDRETPCGRWCRSGRRSPSPGRSRWVPQPAVVHDGVERLVVRVREPRRDRVVQRGGEVLGVEQGPGRVDPEARGSGLDTGRGLQRETRRQEEKRRDAGADGDEHPPATMSRCAEIDDRLHDVSTVTRPTRRRRRADSLPCAGR